MLEIGMIAPDFTLPDKNGNPVTLSSLRGRRVVVYFYPKDNTPGCTRQACAFAANFEKFKEVDAVVIGISKDSIASHKKFAEKYGLPFILLSDPERIAIEAYGVWQEKKMCGKVSMGVVRTTFIIDENGNKVAHIIDPRTGESAVTDVLSATVVAATCAEADAYGTMFMALGKERAIELARRMAEQGVYVYFITAGEDENFEIYYSSQLESALSHSEGFNAL